MSKRRRPASFVACLVPARSAHPGVIAFLVRAVPNRLSYGDDSMVAQRIIDDSGELTIAERA